MAQPCPNCKIPCAPCAGRQLVLASDGAQVCTGCKDAYEMSKGRNPSSNPHPSPNNYQGSAPVIQSVMYNGPNK